MLTCSFSKTKNWAAKIYLEICLITVERKLYKLWIYEYGTHRVRRMLSFSPVVGIGTPPTPHPQASVPPHPVLGGGAHSLWREGLGEFQIPTRGRTLWYSLHIRTLWWYWTGSRSVTYICRLLRDTEKLKLSLNNKIKFTAHILFITGISCDVTV